MDERMKNALGALQAPEEVKERALQGISRKLYRRRPPVWRMATAACALLVFLLVAGGWVYLTPTAYLSVDVNPSLELGINRFGRVVTADAYNEDGEALLEELQVRFASWEEALEEILQLDVVQDPQSVLSLTVAGKDQSQCSRILQQAEDQTSDCGNVLCQKGTLEEREEAHQVGMSLGKYRVYEQILEWNPQFTVEEAQNMTMGELQRLLRQLNPESNSGQGNGSGQGQGQSQGTGMGQGNSSGQGQGQSQGTGMGQGNGAGQGQGQSQGTGTGQGDSSGQGQGQSQGTGTGQGNGSGQGQGQSQGTGKGQGDGSGGGAQWGRKDTSGDF